MKCAIEECSTEFAVLIESHLPEELLPHVICHECWEDMDLLVDERNRSLRIGKRCE